MAGFIAVRMLREARGGGFNPFGENPASDDDEEDDLDDVEEAPDMDPEEAMKYSSAPKVDAVNHWEYDAAVVLDDAAAPAADPTAPARPKPRLAIFGTAWESACEQLYEDDDAEVFCVRWSPDDQLLAAGCGDGVVRIFHGHDGKLAYNLDREGDAVRLPVTCLRWCALVSCPRLLLRLSLRLLLSPAASHSQLAPDG